MMSNKIDELLGSLNEIALDIDNYCGGLPLAGGSERDRYRAAIVEYTNQIIQQERSLIKDVVMRYCSSFDDDYYVCLPPQDVIGDLMKLLGDRQE